MKLMMAISLSLAFSTTIAATASAQIKVSVKTGSGSAVVSTYGSGDPITLDLSNSSYVVIRVWAVHPLTEDVGLITLNDPDTNHEVILLFDETGEYGDAPTTPVCRHWAGLVNHIPEDTKLSGAINGNLTGAVTVDEIARFQVGGQLQSSLTARQPLDVQDTFRIVAGSVGASGEIKANSGDIYEVVVPGDMLGDIRAPGGAIFRLAVGGNIGSPSKLSTITARADPSHPNKEVFELVSAANIYANISGTFVNLSGRNASLLGRLETTGTPGDFVGSLTAGFVKWEQHDPEAGIYISGDLDANITLGSTSAPIEVGGDFAQGRTLVIGQTVTTDSSEDRTGRIYIGGSLLGNLKIGADYAQGVRGFVEINTNNASGVWTGDVEVGTPTGVQTLQAMLPQVHPEYSQLSSEITESGYYGAVGLVPFRLHANDCTPPNGACVSRTETPDSDDEILMRHYGPVYWSGSTPFVISFRGIGDTNWHDVTDCFDQSPAGDPSVVIIQPHAKLRVGCEYLIELRQDSGANVLRCDLAASTPPVADHTSPFIFTVGAASPGDANDDGVVNFDDITIWVTNWQSAACFPPGDSDHDGDVDFDDQTLIVVNWLQEYGDCPSGMMMMMAGVGEGCNRDMEGAITTMGFENATEYAVFLAGLSNDARAMILAAVEEWLNCER